MAAAPLLIVVADDAGVDVARNRGIADGCAKGVIGAVSVLATGAALDDLRARLDDLPPELRPDVGLHLNLTEGRALAGPRAQLADADGAFLRHKRAFWTAALDGAVLPAAIVDEIRAQFARLRDVGLAPTRIDGHQHVHVLPGVRDAVAAVAGDEPEVRWVRLGRPVSGRVRALAPFPRLPRERIAAQWRDLHDAGRTAQAALATLHDECAVLRDAGLRSTALFIGPDLLAAPSLATLGEVVTAAVAAAAETGADSIELMTHPGECDPDSVAFSGDPARDAEREALCTPELPERLRELGVTLGRFRDLECGA